MNPLKTRLGQLVAEGQIPPVYAINCLDDACSQSIFSPRKFFRMLG